MGDRDNNSWERESRDRESLNHLSMSLSKLWDRESGSVRERKERTIAGCGGGGSNDERKRSAMDLEKIVRVLEERERERERKEVLRIF